jgi:hypothetical protein
MEQHFEVEKPLLERLQQRIFNSLKGGNGNDPILADPFDFKNPV